MQCQITKGTAVTKKKRRRRPMSTGKDVTQLGSMEGEKVRGWIKREGKSKLFVVVISAKLKSELREPRIALRRGLPAGSVGWNFCASGGGESGERRQKTDAERTRQDRTVGQVTKEEEGWKIRRFGDRGKY